MSTTPETATAPAGSTRAVAGQRTLRPGRRPSRRPDPGHAPARHLRTSPTGPAGQYGRLVLLHLRRQWMPLIAWLGSLLLLVAVTAPSYVQTYPELAQRTFVVESLRANTATAVLYGPLPDPGAIGQLLVWETGTYVVILGALMGILLAVGLVRRPEDQGTLALIRCSGTPPWLPGAASLTVLLGQCLLLGGGIAAILGIQAGAVEELTVSGALTFGSVVTAVSGAFALLTLVLCQLAPDAPSARAWALTALAAAFAARALPDAGATLDEAGRAPVTALHWISPLGWTQVVAPYTEDRAWPFWVFGAVAGVLLGLGLWLGRGREYQAGLIPRRGGSRRRLRVRSSLGLALRRGLPSWLGWAVAVVGCGALFGGMSSGMLELLEGSDATAQIVRGMVAGGTVTSLYFRLIATFAGILIGIYAVLTVLRVRGDESEGLLDAELGTGRRRWEPLLSAAAVAAAGSIVMAVLGGAVLAAAARAELGEHLDVGQTVAYLALQVPAAVCLAGLTALLVGALPRLSWLIWVLVALSGTLTWLGGLLDAPDWLMDLAVFNHVPDLTAENPAWWPLMLLAGIGLAGIVGALPLMQHRDVRRS